MGPFNCIMVQHRQLGPESSEHVAAAYMFLPMMLYNSALQ